MRASTFLASRLPLPAAWAWSLLLVTALMGVSVARNINLLKIALREGNITYWGWEHVLVMLKMDLHGVLGHPLVTVYYAALALSFVLPLWRRTVRASVLASLVVGFDVVLHIMTFNGRI